MNFHRREQIRLVGLRDTLFQDPGGGLFSGKPREFVLRDATQNLWTGIREDALAYFRDHRIAWWRGRGGLPTGHLLSSQIACVNHLFVLRQRVDLATVLLQAIDPEIARAERIDDGFIAFEFIGRRPLLQERSFSRGANCTSVDAAMLGVTAHGEQRLFLIEWKYVENYPRKDRYIPQRAKVYDHLIDAPNSPFNQAAPAVFYYEPFYQLMRQTLLGRLIAQSGDYSCASYRHVHVVPAANLAFHHRLTAPELPGKNVSLAWRAALREPSLYLSATPEDFLRPIVGQRDTEHLIGYLTQRYWEGDRN